MNNGKSCIICQGRHEDSINRWPDCRVAKIWMELLSMKPENYFDMPQDTRKLIFLGLTPDNHNDMVRFNAMCLAYLMYTAHNQIRHGAVGLNFAVGREEDTTDWAALTLAGAAHGHGFMSRILTERGCFGTNIVGQVARDSKTKRKRPKKTPNSSSKDEAPTSRQRTSEDNSSTTGGGHAFSRGADLNISEVQAQRDTTTASLSSPRR
jgi:hypothetical protein